MDLELIFAWTLTVLTGLAAAVGLIWTIVWLVCASLRNVTSVEREYRQMVERR
jgi:hypothetical protein